MFRDRRTMRANLSQPSDLKACYIACVERGQTLPVSFAIGSHPLDYLAAGLRLPTDEFALVATLRGEPVPMVRGLTNGVLAPADAEMIIEGYFDELGYREQEGPYGEFYGFYGPVHMDPVFHVTAITMRKDVLHQTVFHSGGHLGWTELGQSRCAQCRAADLESLARCRHRAGCGVGRAGIKRTATRAPRAAPGTRGEARLAISALHAIPRVKHIFIVDDDVDVFSDEQMEWAMATRFQGGKRYRDCDRLSRLLHGPEPGRQWAGRQGRLRFDRPLRHSRYDRNTPAARAALQRRNGAARVQARR